MNEAREGEGDRAWEFWKEIARERRSLGSKGIVGLTGGDWEAEGEGRRRLGEGLKAWRGLNRKEEARPWGRMGVPGQQGLRDKGR